jgi:hypothetical protein
MVSLRITTKSILLLVNICCEERFVCNDAHHHRPRSPETRCYHDKNFGHLSLQMEEPTLGVLENASNLYFSLLYIEYHRHNFLLRTRQTQSHRHVQNHHFYNNSARFRMDFHNDFGTSVAVLQVFQIV